MLSISPYNLRQALSNVSDQQTDGKHPCVQTNNAEMSKDFFSHRCNQEVAYLTIKVHSKLTTYQQLIISYFVQRTRGIHSRSVSFRRMHLFKNMQFVQNANDDQRFLIDDTV